MAVNIYDDINRLEATFRKTDEFAALVRAIENVKADEEALNIFRNFRKIQMDLQQKQMAGEEMDGDVLEYAQKTAQLAQNNAKIAGMLQAEMQLSRIIEDVNRILMKPVQTLYEEI
ncbi:YlbF family regulator [Bhargavaea beijingensis]|uniref:UPF0342 protein EJA12_12675 n=1 Tax=Bhargavaea beijingensis TaxID=426756 RepID=A0A1G7DZT0_9BACL|nr:YlbF family regulator [Bhargavaea beijingensis]RSK25054.1 YlbF family regulator [Bhargavaea beijingensis]SDE56969.1 Cell fate regulator YlbF, YheA/YmcA/DUF963 family (controls sporulation, competence, biofilm development) [Bhargavaea beijingensis]